MSSANIPTSENLHFSSLEKIKSLLHSSLSVLEPFEESIVLCCCDDPNVGDNLISLGQVFYLTDILKTKIRYASSITTFSEEVMQQKGGKAPIFFQGGGSLGDLWAGYREFREYIISKYRDRPIIFFPQTMYFIDPINLQRSAKIFNSHPNLTLFIRDDYSYELAAKYFDNCRVVKAPDIAFHLANMPGLQVKSAQKKTILYLCRQDKELNQNFSTISAKLPNLVCEDWASYYPGLKTRLRKDWRKVGNIADEWLSRQTWNRLHPYVAKLKLLDEPTISLKNWDLMHYGVHQFKQHRLVITNRLHGHILCILMGIPHVFLPNSYHKNEAFHQTWTTEIPFCKFVKNDAKIENAVQELLEQFS